VTITTQTDDTSATNGSKQHILALDGLRGIAVINVMFSHGLPSLIPGAFFGVDIFFVLSGYLITTLLLKEHSRYGRIDFLRFYARRALRLLPALLLVLVSIMLVCVALQAIGRVDKNMVRSNFIDGLIALLFATNWARVFTTHGQGLFSHTWSLSLEEQFYLIWPALLVLGLRLTRRRWLLALGTALLTYVVLDLRNWGYQVTKSFDFVFVTRMEPVLIGCVLALLLDESGVFDGLKRRRKLFAFVAPVAVVLLVCCLMAWLKVGQFAFVVVGAVTAVLVLNVLIDSDGWLSRMLAARWLVWMGSISYGLYLWHLPIYSLGAYLGFSPMQIAIVGSALSVTLAACSYLTIERRALKYKQRFAVEAAFIKGCTENVDHQQTRR
jgi:peptidoglycan/LPS O-acetylase OafA/YrhL